MKREGKVGKLSKGTLKHQKTHKKYLHCNKLRRRKETVLPWTKGHANWRHRHTHILEEEEEGEWEREKARGRVASRIREETAVGEKESRMRRRRRRGRRGYGLWKDMFLKKRGGNSILGVKHKESKEFNNEIEKGIKGTISSTWTHVSSGYTCMQMKIYSLTEDGCAKQVSVDCRRCTLWPFH